MARRRGAAQQQRTSALSREPRSAGRDQRVRRDASRRRSQGVSILARAHLALGQPDARARRAVAVLAHQEARGVRRGGHHQGIRHRSFHCRSPLPHGADALRGAPEIGAARCRAGRRQAAGRCVGGRAATATRTPASCSTPCLPRSARPAISSPRPNICRRAKKFSRGRRDHAEGAARQGRAGRSRRVVDRAARAVARAGRPRRHQDRLQGWSRHIRPSRPNNIVDAEFHAGWYALRGLNDPKTAATAFRQRIAEVADGPISLSRAYYWLGRAAEAGGPGNATAYYQKAAVFGTAFYGQLAAARIGSSSISVDLSRRRAASTGRISPIARRSAPSAGSRQPATPRAPTSSIATSPADGQPRRTGAARGDGREARRPFPGAAGRQDRGVARPRHRRAVASGRRDPGIRQYFRRRQGARLCDRAPGERIQCRRRLRRRRARPAAAVARTRPRRWPRKAACPIRRRGSPPMPATMRRWAPPSSASSSAGSTDPTC